VLFELLTGRTPFEADTPAAVLHLHLKEPAPLVSKLCRDVPPELEQLIADLLSKNPDDRPENALVVSQRLDSILRPSRAGFDPFAHTAQDVASPVSSAIVTEDEEAVSSEAALAPHHRQWLGAAWSATVLLLVFSLSQWRQASYWKHEARSWESARIAAMSSAEPSQQIAAMTELGQHGPLSSAAETAIIQALKSPQFLIRQTALKTIEKQPGNLREHITLVRRLQQQDDNAEVRAQAERAAEALKNAPSSGLGGLLWSTFLVMLTLAAAIGPWLYFARPQKKPLSSGGRAAVQALSSARRSLSKI
jgi:serine/threonine protein kinase